MPKAPNSNVEIDGSKVRRHRQLTGLTLITLAEKCELSFQYLSQIERGDRPTVSPPVFVRICNALDVAADQRNTMTKSKAVV